MLSLRVRLGRVRFQSALLHVGPDALKPLASGKKDGGIAELLVGIVQLGRQGLALREIWSDQHRIQHPQRNRDADSQSNIFFSFRQSHGSLLIAPSSAADTR